MWNVAENEEKFDEISDTGELSEDLDFFSIDQGGQIILPKTASFSDATRIVSYEKSDEDNVVATLNYTYEGRDVGSAKVVMATPNTEEFQFTTLEELAKEQEKIVAVDMKKVLTVMAIVLAGVVVTVICVLTLPKLYHKITRKRSQNKKGPKYHKVENGLERRRKRSVMRSEKKNRIKMPKGYK